jgi:tight adherence protein B
MTSSWITLLTFSSVTLLVISVGMLAYDWVFRYRFAVNDRLKELSGAGDADHAISLFKDIARLRSQTLVDSRTWREWLLNLIEQANLSISPWEFAAWCAGTALVAGGIGYCAAWWIAAVAAPLGAWLPFALLFARRYVRSRKLSRQLPEVFQMISRAVRAGQTVPAALKIIAEDFQPPVSEEFALCYEQQNLGISRESALRKLAERSGIMELQIFVVALLVQAKSGGDLVELLDNLAAMIQKRLKLKDRVRALTGEGRMQALVLLVLPIVGMIGILLLAPDYAKSLLDRPWLLAGTAAAQIVGALWVRRIVNFEY